MKFFKVGEIVKEKTTGKVGQVIKINSYVKEALGSVEFEIRIKGLPYYLNAFNVEETTEQEIHNYLMNEVAETL